MISFNNILSDFYVPSSTRSRIAFIRSCALHYYIIILINKSSEVKKLSKHSFYYDLIL